MLVDQRYMFSSFWHRYCLFTPLVTFFLTRHHKIATVHNIHIGTGSGLKHSCNALTWAFRKAFPSDTSHCQKSHFLPFFAQQNFGLHTYVCVDNPTTKKQIFGLSVPLHADLAACFGTHIEALIVQMCGPLESMQYIFPGHFQRNQSKVFSNPLANLCPF